MEFNRPARPSRGQSRLVTPKRSEPTARHSNPPVAADSPAAAPAETKEEATSSTSARATTAILSRSRRILFKKRAIILGTLAVVVVSSLTVNAFIRQRNINNANGSHALIENLEYQTVLPEGKSIGALGGWKRVSPEGNDPVYAYVDTIAGVSVTVSQQPLPESFAGSADNKVSEVAKRFNATTKIDAGDTKAYLGTSAKGPQSVILTKNGLLILIKSQTKVDTKNWVDYVKSLH